jgi:hypothetical protein
MNDEPHRRLAVILCGPLRTAAETAESFKRHVLGDRDAAIFYFGPGYTDAPGAGYGGEIDLFGTFKRNPKSEVTATQPVEEGLLRSIYGEQLLRWHLHDRPQSDFVKQSEAVISSKDWLMQLNPYRMFSMFYNIEGGARLLLEYERESGTRFDDVIITRPDLAFYSPVEVKPRNGEIHIPKGEGIDINGSPHRGNARVFFYKNVATGDFVSQGETFNDQFYAFTRDALSPFLSLTEALPRYLDQRVPPSPETILYLHLVARGGLVPVPHPEWTYEIHRRGAPQFRNVADTPAINFVDRSHPAAIERRRRHPVRSWLRDMLWLARRAVKKVLG